MHSFLIKTIRIAVLSSCLFVLCFNVLRAEGNANFIRTFVDNESPYVQQSIRYTIQFWRQSSLFHGHFVKPEIANCLVIEAESLPVNKTTLNNQYYEVIEQNYFIIPQQSGALTLPEPVFSSREIFYKGSPLAIKIRPQPEDFLYPNWLIANRLNIEENWSTDTNRLEQGEILERIITLKAEGIIGAQLINPELENNNPYIHKVSDVNSYSVDNGKLQGKRTIKYRYLTEQATKEVIIPPLSFVWWNANKNTQGETIKLEEKIFIIDKIARENKGITTEPQLPLNSSNSIVIKSDDYDRYRLIDRLLWFFLIIIILFMVFISRNDTLLKRLKFQIKNFINCYRIKRKLFMAIDRQEWLKVKELLLDTLKVNKNNWLANNLIALSKQASTPLKEQLKELDQYLYGLGEKPAWDKKIKQQLWQFILSCKLSMSLAQK